MWDSRAEADRWLKQAENDLEFARLGLREGFFAQVCFLPTRYPNGLPGGFPFMAFNEEQARNAIAAAERFLRLAAERIGAVGG